MENSQEFVLRPLGDFGLHAVAPDVGNILVRQQPFFGSRIGEAMRQGILIVADHQEHGHIVDTFVSELQ
jgi:hypothetical protein